MPDGSRFPPKVCKDCGLESPEVFFDKMSKNQCSRCKAIESGDRNRRTAQRKALFVRVEPEPVDDPQRAEAHLSWIRKMPCSTAGLACRGPIVAHHVRENSGAGIGLKPGPEWTVPLCDHHHKDGHTRGWVTFAGDHKVDLRTLAISYSLISPHISEEIKHAMRLEKVNADG